MRIVKRCSNARGAAHRSFVTASSTRSSHLPEGAVELAFADVSMNTAVTVGDPPMGALSGANGETKVGWTLGGGAEYAVTDHVTIKAEAL